MDEDGNPLDRDFAISNLSTESILSAWAECSRFIRECETDLPHLDDEHAGRNFWLTRNSHGRGFFDEKVDDESAEIAMQQLTRASEAFGEVDLYIGDDRKLHCYDAFEVKREDFPLVFVFVGLFGCSWFLFVVCLLKKHTV